MAKITDAVTYKQIIPNGKSNMSRGAKLIVYNTYQVRDYAG